MGQQSKYTFEMKLFAVMKYLEGNTSLESLARRLGTNGKRVVEWVTLYQSLGAEGLKAASRLSTYSVETKQKAVFDYPSGEGTLWEIKKSMASVQINNYATGL